MAEPKQPEPGVTGDATTVTVVNDDPDACEVVARVLEAAGHTVTRLSQPDEALALLGADPPSAVVIDLVASPPGAGLAMLDTLRAHTDETLRTARVLVIAPESSTAQSTPPPNADGFLVRPMHADALVEAVAEALDRRDEDRVVEDEDRVVENDAAQQAEPPEPP